MTISNYFNLYQSMTDVVGVAVAADIQKEDAVVSKLVFEVTVFFTTTFWKVNTLQRH